MSSGPCMYALMSGVGSMLADAGIVTGSGEDIQFHKRQGGILGRRKERGEIGREERKEAGGGVITFVMVLCAADLMALTVEVRWHHSGTITLVFCVLSME